LISPKKFILNHVVAVSILLPNVAINGGTQAILDVYFHWTGWLSLLAWVIGAALSIEYGILFSMKTKTNLTAWGKKWNYGED
jgi:hypothetical protein